MNINYRSLLKYFSLIVVTVGILSITGCCVDNLCETDYNSTENKIASKDYVQKITLQDQHKLNLSAINGDIQIFGISDRDTMTIEAEFIATGETQDLADEYVEKLQIQILESESGIQLISQHPVSNNASVSTLINYSLYIPNNWEIDIEHTNGNITITEIQNKLDITLTNGIFEMEDIEGSVIATLVNGTIEGNLILPPEGDCHLRAYNGIIDMNFPKETSADFDARVTNGTIQVSGFVFSNLETDTHYTRGQLGDGNGKILLELLNGQIVVKGY